jgi:hypothetical protein
MKNIHEQVRMQLEYLKSSVDGEIEREARCKELGITYTPSRRRQINIDNYEMYKEEIEKNGDKNLLVMVYLNGEDGIRMYGTYPFARRYKNEGYLVHKNEYGTRFLLHEDEARIVVSK